ncbi:MAG: GNAT family N-acetyltransferase, partial [Nitrososphaerota archaeon]|nr:GNAT family N-acetyltransferase [Nitrososphaerota archaeon]
MRVEIKQERADTPEAMRMLDELDRYLISLYPPESNHLLSISELLEPNVSFFVARMNGTAVGCGALLIKSGYGEIKRMFVKPEKRGLGV